jgi:protein tyrosine/serine phosphatase
VKDMLNKLSFTRMRNVSAALVFSLSLLASAAASQPQAIRIDNFGRVDATLYRGAQPSGHDFADLKALGVKTIVDLTGDDTDPHEKAASEAAGMTYVRIPMNTHIAPTAAQLQQFLNIVNDPASQPVYVHCVGGRHRTGVMTAAYRISHEGWTGEQAFREMKQYNFGADFLHPEFKQFVYSFQPSVTAKTAAATSATTVTAAVQR